MKNLLIFIAAFLLLTITSQAQQIAQTNTENVIEMGTTGEVDGEKLVGVYRQIETHSEQLKTTRKDYQEKLASALIEKEKIEFIEIIANIDEMLLTNERLLSGDATIQNIDTVKNSE